MKGYDCGTSGMGLRFRRILNGVNTVGGDWPWLVHLNTGCTGAIVSERYVLSAAHCVYKSIDGELVKPKYLNILAGSSNIANALEKVEIVRAILHPEFVEEDTSTPDIALFQLAKKLKFSRRIGKICLPKAFSEFYGQTAVVAGWGSDKTDSGTNNEKKSANIAQEAMIPLNDPIACVEHLHNLTYGVEFDPKYFICGGGTLRGTENGDSGGPLMFNEKGRWFQIGLTSFGETGPSNRNDDDSQESGEEEKPKMVYRKRVASNSTGLHGRFYDVGAYTRISENCAWIERVTNREVLCLDVTKAPLGRRRSKIF